MYVLRTHGEFKAQQMTATTRSDWIAPSWRAALLPECGTPTTRLTNAQLTPDLHTPFNTTATQSVLEGSSLGQVYSHYADVLVYLRKT